jgi:ABC-2 type transport system permease protein
VTESLKLITVEAKLFLREPAAWILSVILPTFVLVLVSAIPGLRESDADLGGLRFIDLYVPTMIVLALAVLGVNTLPIRLAGYREKGVLRRLSTTPVHPARLLMAQLAINMIAAIASVALPIVAGAGILQIPMPRNVVGFIATFILGMSSLFAIGTLIAAIAPSVRTGNALTWPVFVVVMFLGGVYVPRVALPELLQRLGDYAPPGVQAMLDAWMGTGPRPEQLVALAAITVIAGAASVRLFRWE